MGTSVSSDAERTYGRGGHRHDGHGRTGRETILPTAETLETCDGWLVLVADPATGDLDTYGPYPHPEAARDAERRRRELDDEDLGDVVVTLVRWHRAS